MVLKKAQLIDSQAFFVPGAGIEPALCCQNWILNPARLPIPPPGLFPYFGGASTSHPDSYRDRDRHPGFSLCGKGSAKLIISAEMAKSKFLYL